MTDGLGVVGGSAVRDWARVGPSMAVVLGWHLTLMLSAYLLGRVPALSQHLEFPYPLLFAYFLFYVGPQLVMIVAARLMLIKLVRRTSSPLVAGSAAFWLTVMMTAPVFAALAIWLN